MSEQDLIWIIDDDRSIRWVLEKAIGRVGLEAYSFADGNSVMRKLETQKSLSAISVCQA